MVVDVAVDEDTAEVGVRSDSRRRTTSDARWVISESSWGVGCVCGEDVWSCATERERVSHTYQLTIVEKHVPYRVANSYSTLQ